MNIEIENEARAWITDDGREDRQQLRALRTAERKMKELREYTEEYFEREEKRNEEKRRKMKI